MGVESSTPRENLRAPKQRALPLIGLGFALTLPRLLAKPKPAKGGAYVQCRLYDETKQYLGAQQIFLTPTGNAWAPYQLVAQVSAKGYIQVVLGNAASTPVWVDDVQATAVRRVAQPVEESSPAAQTATELSAPFSRVIVAAATPPTQTGKNATRPPVVAKLKKGTCTQYTDTYYNIYTGEVLWQEVYTVCDGADGPGVGGGDGGGGTRPGGGGGGGGRPSSVPNIPSKVAKQATPNTCVPATMAAISYMCNSHIDEATIDLWYDQHLNTSGNSVLLNGVSSSDIGTLVSQFFNVTVVYPVNNTIGIINQIQAGHPVMIDVPTGNTSGSTIITHSVVITGYNPNDPTQFYYLDPLEGITKISNAATLMAQAHYMIPIIGCK